MIKSGIYVSIWSDNWQQYIFEYVNESKRERKSIVFFVSHRREKNVGKIYRE